MPLALGFGLGAGWWGLLSGSGSNMGIATQNTRFYVDPVNGNDGNLGITPNTAVKSIAALNAVAGTTVAHLKAMELVVCPGTVANVADGTVFAASVPIGPNATPWTMRGYANAIDDPTAIYGISDSWQTVAGPFTVVSKVASDNAAITFTQAGVTLNQYQGLRVLGITGGMAGAENGVRSNSAGTTVTLNWSAENNLVNVGDTFVIQQPMSIIPCKGISFLGECGLITGGLKFNVDASGANGAQLGTYGSWYLSGPTIAAAAGIPFIGALQGSLTIGYPAPTLASPAYVSPATLSFGRSTYIKGCVLLGSQGTSSFINALVHDGAAGNAYIQNSTGSYMKMLGPYCTNGSNINNYGVMELYGHHAVFAQVDSFTAGAPYSWGAYTGFGPASKLNALTYFNVSSLGAGTDVVHVRAGASAIINGNSGTAGTGIVTGATPGTGAFSVQAAADGSIVIITGTVAAGTSGAQTAVDGVSHDLATYAGSTHTTGSGAGAITISGTPNADYAVKAKAATGGALGTAGGLSWTLDGSTDYATPVVSAASTIIPGTGLTILMSAATYVTNDEWTLNATGRYANGNTSIRTTAATPF